MSETKKPDELYGLIDKIEVAMLTTFTAEGNLSSRPMMTQDRQGGDLWFMTNVETHKIAELKDHPQVNLAYFDAGSREWVSVSGTASVSLDRERIRRLYRPSWKPWFTQEGAPRDGGPEDPRIALIDVRVNEAAYYKLDQPRPIVLFKIAVAALSRNTPQIGDVQHVGAGELRG